MNKEELKQKIINLLKLTGRIIVKGMKALVNYQMETYKKWDKEFAEEDKKKKEKGE